MLSRSHRLSTRQFNETIKSGKVFHSALFLARIMRATDGRLRIAAVAPVKVAKTAVLRNRTRRRIYEAVKPITKDLKGDFTIILLAKSGATDALLVELAGDLHGLFVKAGVLR